MPEPPAGPSPATIQRIQGVQARARTKAVAHSALPGGAAQVGAARKAVTEPEAEAVAKAQAALMAQVKAAPSPEIVKLGERIREVIRKKRPPDEDALMAAEPEAEAANAGKELNATVDGETKKVQGNYGPMNDAINRNDPSDRLLAAWPTHGSIEVGDKVPPRSLVVPTPDDIVVLRRTDPAEAASWRLRVREELGGAIAAGARVVNFSVGSSEPCTPRTASASCEPAFQPRIRSVRK